jgi:hypothetical protein
MKVDLIVATSSTESEPARRATSTIPIVFAAHADPVGRSVADARRPRPVARADSEGWCMGSAFGLPYALKALTGLAWAG